MNKIGKSIEELKQQLQKAKEVLNDKKIIDILEKILIEYQKARNLLKLKEVINELIPLYELKGLKNKKGKILIYYGQVLFQTANFEKSITILQTALEIFKELTDSLNTAISYTLIGNAYNELGKYEESLTNLFSAINIFEKYKKTLGKSYSQREKRKFAETFQIIGNVYQNLKQFDKCRENLYKSLKLLEEIGNAEGIANILTNIGVSYSKENSQESLTYYKQALEIVKKLDNPVIIAINTSNIGGVYEDMKQYDNALHHYFEALEYAEKFNIDKYKPYFLEYIGSVYLKKGELGTASEYIKKSLLLSQKQQIPNQVKNNYQLLSQIFEKQKKYQIALEYYQKYSELKDKLINKEMIGKISSLQKKYEENANKIIELKKHNSLVSDKLRRTMDMDFIGTSAQIKKVLEMAMIAASHPDTNVIILGESGTGKEIISNIIHYASSRKDNPLVAINCSSIPDSLAESEFFGFTKGSFTGAISDKTGYFELADKGTLFMDEIADTSLSLQAKLLRVLDNKKIKKIGSKIEIKVNFRVIAATNKNISALVESEYFRLDLLHRINTIEIEIPPLRERVEDIKPLLEYFTRKFAEKLRKPIPKINIDVIDKLKRYNFPGNIRELKNMTEKAMILLKGDVLKPKHFGLKDQKNLEEIVVNIYKPKTVAEMEKQMIVDTMKETNNNQTKAAKILGFSLSTLKRKLKSLNDF